MVNGHAFMSDPDPACDYCGCELGDKVWYRQQQQSKRFCSEAHCAAYYAPERRDSHDI
jgi:hypothetical protein